MTAEQVRCFWRWPLGHRWALEQVEGEYLKRCQECDRAKNAGTPAGPPRPPPSGWDAGSSQGYPG